MTRGGDLFSAFSLRRRCLRARSLLLCKMLFPPVLLLEKGRGAGRCARQGARTKLTCGARPASDFSCGAAPRIIIYCEPRQSRAACNCGSWRVGEIPCRPGKKIPKPASGFSISLVTCSTPCACCKSETGRCEIVTWPGRQAGRAAAAAATHSPVCLLCQQ